MNHSPIGKDKQGLLQKKDETLPAETRPCSGQIGYQVEVLHQQTYQPPGLLDSWFDPFLPRCCGNQERQGAKDK